MLENKINPDDYSARFQDCICRYKGEPVRVNVHGRTRFELIFLDRRDPITINPTDKDFDISSIPMGYFNHNGRAMSCVRSSRRRYTQGVTQRNVTFYDLRGQATPEPISIYSGSIREMVLGNYPSAEKAIQSLRSGDCESVAISRRISLEYIRTEIINIFVSHKLLGWIPPHKDYAVIEDSKISRILSEELRELGIETKGK